MPRMLTIFLLLSFTSFMSFGDTGVDAQDADELGCRPPKPWGVDGSLIKPSQVMCAMKTPHPVVARPIDLTPQGDEKEKSDVKNEQEDAYENDLPPAPHEPEVTEPSSPAKKCPPPRINLHCPVCIKAPCPCPRYTIPKC